MHPCSIRVTRLKLSFVCPYCLFCPCLCPIFVASALIAIAIHRNTRIIHMRENRTYRYIYVHNTFHLSIDILGVFYEFLFIFSFFIFSFSLFLFLSTPPFSLFLSICLSIHDWQNRKIEIYNTYVSVCSSKKI